MEDRIVIGRGKTHNQLVDNGAAVKWDTCGWVSSIPRHNLPPGVPVELVALVKRERKLIRPEGAVWWYVSQKMLPNTPYDGYFLLTPKAGVVASVYCGAFRTEKKSGSGMKSDREAQLTAEHAFADAGLYGFGWEEATYDRYVIEVYRRGKFIGNTSCDKLEYAEMEMEQDSNVAAYDKSIIFGYIGEQRTEIKRWERAIEKGEGDE